MVCGGHKHPRPWSGGVCRFGWIIAAILGSPSVIPAQTAEAPPADPTRPPPAQRSDVYINESFEAADALSKAKTHAERGRWREAAEALQQASDTQGDKLVRWVDGFVGARRRIADVICAWPDDGLKVYRTLFDHELESALASVAATRSVDSLLSLFERYFCTTGAPRLADAVGQLAIESGDLPLAEYVYRRVAEQHPDARNWKRRCVAMMSLIAAIRGEPVDLEIENAGEERIRWRGHERPLRDVIGEIGRGFDGLRDSTMSGDWPTYDGAPDRNRRSATRVDEPELLWRYAFVDDAASARRGGIVDALVQSGRDEGRGLTMFPVVAGDLVYAQRYRDIVAVHRRSGAEAWRLRSSDRASDPMSYLDDRPPGWDSPTVDQGRIFATLPADESTYYDYHAERDVHELICLDARTGREIWRATQGAPDAQGTIAAFDSSPIVRGHRVHVVSRKRRSFGFEDAYLDCYDSRDGRLLYRTHLGSASTSSFGQRGATKAVIAVSGDSVFVNTNLGTVASVSAYTGSVRWLRVYDRYRFDPSKASGWSVRDIQPWHFNSVIVSEGRLIVLPVDSSRLLILSADDGRLRESVPLESIGNMQSVYGVRGNLLCGAGESIVCYDLTDGKVQWSRRLPEGASPFGRGAWSGDDLLVPRRDGISRFRVVDGERIDLRLGANRHGGNLLAMPDHLLVAGVDELSCYARKSEIWNDLRERMAAAPNDPIPALEFAEVAFGAGEIDQALSVFDEAVRRVAPSFSPGDETVRERILNDVLRFAGPSPGAPSIDEPRLERLYVIASETARDAAQNIAFRFRFAEVFVARQKPERAVRLYQQVLRDRSLRDLPAFPNDATPQQAGAYARMKIAELMDRFGPGVYAEFDSESSQWLESAINTGDETRLRAVVETFPNSRSAPLAMIALGDRLARTRQFDQAARQYARAYSRLGDAGDRTELIRKIVDVLRAGGRPEHAYLWLTKAIREFPRARVDLDGRSVSFSEYRDRLGDVRSRVEPSRPRIILPLERRYELAEEPGVRLLIPQCTDDPSARWNQWFVHSPRGIRAFDSATGKQRWTAAFAPRVAPELLVAREEVVVLATPYQIVGLDARSGETRWTVGEHPARLADPGGDWEDVPAFRAHALHARQLLSARDDGSMTCVDVAAGNVLWSESRKPAPLGRLRLTDTLAAFHYVRDGAAVIGLLDAATGERLAEIVTGERRSVEDLFVTFDRQIIVATSQSLASYDVETLSPRWQTSFSWFLRSPTLAFGLDTVAFVDESGDLHGVSLEDGRVLWQTDRVVGRGEDDVTLHRQGDDLIVTSASNVAAFDGETGLLLWQGTTPTRTRFVARLLTDAYVVAVNLINEPDEKKTTAYFYDFRNASGAIARNGGALDLGGLTDIRTALTLDGAIVIQSGESIRGFARE